MQTQESPAQPRLLTWHVFVLLLAEVVALYTRFFRASTLGFFEDDFFYYAEVARNLATHGISSFDGVHLTNGYHPLWLVTLTGLYTLVQGTAFLVAVQTVSLVLLLSFYVAALRVLERLGAQHTRLAALLLSLHALLLFRYGMEVSAALPLGMATLAYGLGPRFRWTTGQTLRYGLLACATVLARLDAAMLIALLFAGQTLAADVPWSTRWKRTGLFSVAFLPFFVYLAVNVHVFHSMLPVSGHAKQMKPLWPGSWTPVYSLLLPMDRMKAAFVVPALLLLAVGMVRLPRLWRTLPRGMRPVYVALFVFPFVHTGSLDLLSDWPVWPWYFYSLTFSSVAAMALLLQPVARRVWVPVLAAASGFYLLYVGVYSVGKRPSTTFLLGNDVASFARQHPGNYAIGDDAGAAGWISGQPIVQLEGLTMDADYLKLVAARVPLAEALRHYHTQYYVVLGAMPGPDGCTHVAEPNHAGPLSPHMPGVICATPLARFERGGVSMTVFDAAAVR